MYGLDFEFQVKIFHGSCAMRASSDLKVVLIVINNLVLPGIS